MPMNFDWEERYSVGNPLLDEQHQILLSLCRRATEGQTKGDSATSAETQEILSELAEYTMIHFMTEEALMKDAGYPGIKQQIQEHRDYAESLTDFLISMGTNGVDNGALVEYLTLWWTSHILDADMQYKGLI